MPRCHLYVWLRGRGLHLLLRADVRLHDLRLLLQPVTRSAVKRVGAVSGTDAFLLPRGIACDRRASIPSESQSSRFRVQMQPRYKLVIFDFDGTLANSFPWFLRVFSEVADRFRFRRIEAGEIDLLRGYSGRELVRHLGVPSWKLPFIARHLRRLKARDLATVSLFPGVDELLRSLSDMGVRVAVVSSNADENVRRILGAENVARVRHFECGASLFGKRSSFRRVLRRSGMAASEALCVGDEIRDLEAARAAGIAFGAVTWGYTTAEALRARRPEEVFETLAEIAETVTSTSAAS